MKTSASGRAAITAREGRRLVAYRDSVGVWTIGVGHTGRMAPPKVAAGMRITSAQADAFLEADLAPVERVLATAVTVPITQNEYDAMVSLGFNIGEGGLKRSSVVKRLNLGDVPGAADAFMGWSRPAVLVARRKAERAQFLRPDDAVHSDASPTRLVIAKRGAALVAKSDKVAVGAKASAGIAASYGAFAVGAATLAAPTSHHHGVLLTFAVLFAIGAVVTALLAIRRHVIAQTLSANAKAHDRAAQMLGTTDLVTALRQ